MEANEIAWNNELGTGKVRCLFCKRWVQIAELGLNDLEGLQEAPCPHCGDTGAALREKQEEVKRALEGRGVN